MGPLWEVYTIKKQSASQGTTTEGLEERGWVGEGMVTILAKTMVLSIWQTLLPLLFWFLISSA